MAFVHTCGKGPVFLTPFGHDAEALRAPGTTKLFAAIRSGTPINHGDYMARSTLIATMGQLSSYAGHNRGPSRPWAWISARRGHSRRRISWETGEGTETFSWGNDPWPNPLSNVTRP
jgi:hypothetical protein